jgi:hypothetical protein
VSTAVLFESYFVLTEGIQTTAMGENVINTQVRRSWAPAALLPVSATWRIQLAMAAGVQHLI